MSLAELQVAVNQWCKITKCFYLSTVLKYKCEYFHFTPTHIRRKYCTFYYFTHKRSLKI